MIISETNIYYRKDLTIDRISNSKVTIDSWENYVKQHINNEPEQFINGLDGHNFFNKQDITNVEFTENMLSCDYGIDHKKVALIVIK